MKLVDTHAHLFWDDFKDNINDVVIRAKDNNIGAIINVGVNLKTSQLAVQQQINDIKIYSAIGIHPEEAINFASPNDIAIKKIVQELSMILQNNSVKNNQIIAVGEIGLDFYFADNPWSGNDTSKNLAPQLIRDTQMELFTQQLNLARLHKLPVLIHCRDNRSLDPRSTEAFKIILSVIQDYPAILHCYSGLEDITKKLISKKNILISFAGNITYPKNLHLREAVKQIPLNRIILETDCPFLPPQKFRGQSNEPSYIIETAKTVADIKSITLEEVTRQTTTNFLDFFSIEKI